MHWCREHIALISWITVFALIYLGSLKVQGHYNYGWWFWAGLLIVMNVLTYHQEQAPNYPMLPPSRWPLALLAAIMLVLTFTITPFQTL